jgi:glycine/D-amino acid oxidase-like deaminating enzyme/nitrite reductase/ring-hydroxylating ferredoxin subunit
MKAPDGLTTSIWYDKVIVPHYPALPAKPVRCDVCVVGAGIAGLTAAYLLAQAGKSVVVLDEGPIGGGQTGRTSAHLASAIDDRFVEVERLHGEQVSRLAYQSHAAAIDKIEEIAQKEKIKCDFHRLNGLLFALPNDSKNLLHDELAAAKRAGFSDIELLVDYSIAGWEHVPCLRFGEQARFHPLKYLVGLAKAFTKLKGRIFIGSRVIDVQGSDPKKKSRAKAKSSGRPAVEADAIIVSTNTPAPINDWIGIYLKQASYRSYVVALKIPPGSVEDALYWDTADPYHYVRLEKNALIVGGEDHKTGQYPKNTDPFANLESWAKEKFPMVGKVLARWSGQVQEPADYLGYAGKAPTSGENVYVITGDSGMGLTHGTLGAMLISDLIQGRENPWTEIYDPTRLKIDTDLVSENANTIMQYTQLLSGGDVADVQGIAPGEGAVIRRGLHKIAVYKHANGKTTEHSAICPHLKCVVHWNPTEKTWDCPCHGSRFSCDGKVLMGPAVNNLPSIK